MTHPTFQSRAELEAEDDCHVLPLNDLRDHREHRDCWCRPQILIDDCGSPIIIHNSMDRREHTIEKGITQ